MKKLVSVLAAGAALVAAPAYADPLNGAYAGAQVGYHDVGDILGGDVAGLIYGGYLGVNSRFGRNFVLGAEGNYNLGSSDIDSDYGLNAHVGVAMGPSTMVFLRGGYQWVDFDLVNISEDLLGRPLTQVEIDALDGVDDSDGGALFGGGVQFGLGPNASFRGVVDTIEFDTIRVTGGVALHF